MDITAKPKPKRKPIIKNKLVSTIPEAINTPKPKAKAKPKPT